MNVARVRDHCRRLPGTTEQLQWGNHILFKIGGRMFCVTTPEPDPPTVVSFKCDDERFAELVERDGVIPAPYLARARWVALERWDALEDSELFDALTAAYRVVRGKLPRKVQASLPEPEPAASPRRRRGTGPRATSKRAAIASRKRRGDAG